MNFNNEHLDAVETYIGNLEEQQKATIRLIELVVLMSLEAPDRLKKDGKTLVDTMYLRKFREILPALGYNYEAIRRRAKRQAAAKP